MRNFLDYFYIFAIIMVFVLVLYTLYDVITSKKVHIRYKGLAALVIILFPILGSIVYFALKPKLKE